MKCNLCNSNDIKDLYNFNTHKIVKCKKCNLVFTDQNSIKLPKEKLYNNNYFIKRPFFEDCKKGYDNKKSKKIEKFKRGITLIEKYYKKGKILDLGCATGIFLDIAKKRGWDSYGVDISKYACDYAKSNFKLNIKQGELKGIKFSKEKFDVITMWDFIEHVDNPTEILEEIYRILKPKRIIFILTTNEQSLMCWLANIFYKIKIKFFARLVHPYHHNYYFSEKTLKKYLIKSGFKIIYKEKDEMPIENIENSFIIRFMAKILYLFSYITNSQHEIILIGEKNGS